MSQPSHTSVAHLAKHADVLERGPTSLYASGNDTNSMRRGKHIASHRSGNAK